jgi:hypothetical protein
MQAHGEHPPFEAPSAEGERAEAVQCLPAVAVADRTTASAPRARFSARFSVKTCGGCHYDQYQHWRSGDHANLARMLPEQQLNNQDCQQCHPAAGMVAKMASMDEGADRTWVGVACESCHGPAVEHVVFNRRLISAPPLGAKMEEAARRSIRKGKPSSTCIQCHVHERHGEHPEFKKE